MYIYVCIYMYVYIYIYILRCRYKEMSLHREEYITQENNVKKMYENLTLTLAS